jgi:hypothetical protein
MTTYVGNAAYCYANTTTMLLASVGESVSPSLVEVLTGVGLGASWDPSSRLAFFDSVAPDVGVSRALDLLGFDCQEQAGAARDPAPLDDLRRALAAGPVALGPIDMGDLSYIPWASQARGSDHFVLAYAIDAAELRLHDPAGFPHASLPLTDLEPAWRAERIPYRRGAFRRWFAPRRRERVPADELFARALASFRATAADRPVATGVRSTGPSAIRAFAAHLRAGPVTPDLDDHMTHFLFSLAARRALDYASFFEPRRADLAALKRRQAEQFGRCHVLAVRKEWPSLADALEPVAAIELQIARALNS